MTTVENVIASIFVPSEYIFNGNMRTRVVVNSCISLSTHDECMCVTYAIVAVVVVVVVVITCWPMCVVLVFEFQTLCNL